MPQCVSALFGFCSKPVLYFIVILPGHIGSWVAWLVQSSSQRGQCTTASSWLDVSIFVMLTLSANNRPESLWVLCRCFWWPYQRLQFPAQQWKILPLPPVGGNRWVLSRNTKTITHKKVWRLCSIYFCNVQFSQMPLQNAHLSYRFAGHFSQ